MATVNYAVEEVKEFGENAHVVLWEELTATNADGQPLQMPGSNIRSVQVTGNFGGGSQVDIEGSNDGSNWEILNDLDGNAASLTAAGLVGVRELPRYIRPNVSTSDGSTDLDVTLILVRRGR